MPQRLAIAAIVVALTLAGCGTEDQEFGADSGADPVDGGLGDTGDSDADADTGLVDANDVGDDTDADDPWQSLPERPWPVTEAGHFSVAYRYEEVTYVPRGDAQEPRTFELSIWYPTFEEDGEQARYINLINRPGVWQDAPPAIREPAPVMLFSHGNAALSVQSPFWTEFLASHGWVVIAPDHTGNTFSDTDGAINLSSAEFRPQDLSAALDFVLDLPDGDPLQDGLSEDIAVSGHSFGGTTTLSIIGAQFPVDDLQAQCDSGELTGRYCEIVDDENADIFRQGFLDPRISVAIPQSPGGGAAFGSGLQAIDMPVLLWTAAEDGMTPNDEDGDPIWASLDGPDDVRIDVANTAHFTFSDMCEFFGTVDQIASEGCGDEFMPPAEVHPLHNAYSLAFLRHHLFGDPAHDSWFDADHEPLHENLIFFFK